MTCHFCQKAIIWTQGKAFTGYVHVGTGQATCESGKTQATVPNYFDNEENRRNYDRARAENRV